tara:strand:+ start:830 stop:1270 length:441 start_codon:yes stop_codon:yes gene_type:complete
VPERSIKVLKTANLGRGKAGLSTVGFTIFNAEGTETSSRSTTGVHEIGTGTGLYGAQVSLASAFSGSIMWDSGDGSSKVYAVEEINAIDGSVQYIKDLTAGKWEIDGDSKQMIFYAEDNATELARYNLKDSAGAGSVTEVFQRVKV